MAKSNAHRWGQIIGNVFQSSVHQFLSEIANRHGLYLDQQGARAARAGRKVRWQDRFGNVHDLDYVFERGGSETVQGAPAAFIETAWRRYSKHAKNKVQEIEGALVPLQQTYGHLHPFLGAILAGDFTQSSLIQLRSRGFSVLHFPTQMVVAAFDVVGIDATSTEQTSEDDFAAKVAAWQNLTPERRSDVKRRLLDTQSGDLIRFREALSGSLSRTITGIVVTTWRGTSQLRETVADAIAYLLSNQALTDDVEASTRYEVDFRYTNGDIVHASFQERQDAITFLQSFE